MPQFDLPERPKIPRIKLWKIWKLGSRIDQKDLDNVVEILPLRELALEEAINGLKRLKTLLRDFNLTNEQLFALASTDVFVEKAQRVLTRRARNLYVSGIITTALTFIVLGVAIFFVYLQITADVPQAVTTSTQLLILKIFDFLLQVLYNLLYLF